MSSRRVTYEHLIAYAEGELSGPDAAEIEARLARDPGAAGTVARYRMARAIVRADDAVDAPQAVVERAKAIYQPGDHAVAEPGVLDHLGAVIARLIFDSRAEPAPAGMRGHATSFQLSYELTEESGQAQAQLDLQAELAEDDGDARSWRLVGQIAAPSGLPPTPVALCRAGSLTPIRTTDSDDLGVFVLRTEPGTYDLHLHLTGGLTVVPNIRIT